MLPIPFETHGLPKLYRDNLTPAAAALAAKIDALLTEWKADLVGILCLRWPERIPAALIPEAAHMLGARLLAFDDERTRRKKLRSAVAGHKERSLWFADAKPDVDSICGGDATIYTQIDQDDWIQCDGTEPASVYWAALGYDGADTHLGIALIGEGIEVEISGNVYVNVDNAALSAADQVRLRETAEEWVPAYMKVHFGYLTGLAFTEYFLME